MKLLLIKMVQKITHKRILYIFAFGIYFISYRIDCLAQDESNTAKPIINIEYYNNSGLQYLMVSSKLKIKKELFPQSNISYELYLNESIKENLIGKLTTDEIGKAIIYIPASLKSIWDSTTTHTFILKKDDEEIISDYTITKSKITIDTSAEGDKHILVNIKNFDGKNWKAVPDLEIKVGVNCVGGVLSAGEEASYTTDEEGNADIEFLQHNLPGDKDGKITLVAKVEANEELGTVSEQIVVPWGIPTVTSNSFFEKRALWATRYRTPLWLLGMAYAIVIGVWGTLIYLVYQIVKIKKIGVRQ